MWEMKAFKYYFIPGTDLGVAGNVIEPTPNFLRRQEKLANIVAPFTAIPQLQAVTGTFSAACHASVTIPVEIA